MVGCDSISCWAPDSNFSWGTLYQCSRVPLLIKSFLWNITDQEWGSLNSRSSVPLLQEGLFLGVMSHVRGKVYEPETTRGHWWVTRKGKRQDTPAFLTQSQYFCQSLKVEIILKGWVSITLWSRSSLGTIAFIHSSQETSLIFNACEETPLAWHRVTQHDLQRQVLLEKFLREQGQIWSR